MHRGHTHTDTNRGHTKANGYHRPNPVRHIPKTASARTARSNHYNHRSNAARSNSTRHVPHNSHTNDYRLYKGIESVSRRGGHNAIDHKHHNSLASNVNHHGRGNTMKFLDESLD